MNLAKWTALRLVMVGLVIASGCSSSAPQAPKARIVGLEEFVIDRQSAPVQDAPHSSSQVHADLPSSTSTSTSSSPPQVVAELEPGDTVVIDRLVGQVSGRPIFADDILEPIADLLRQQAARLSPQEFGVAAAQIVNSRLQEVVLNELFIAEAEVALTEQQQQGLLALMRDFQERKLAEQRGSRSLLEKELGLEGMTPEQLVELEKNKMLIMNLINEKITPRVIVSWRDVEREYERRKAEFMPKSQVTFRRIRLSGEDSAAIEAVKSKLDAGEAFSEVAAAAGMADGGLWEAFTINSDPPDVSDIEINEAYKPLLKGLRAGEHTAPIDIEGRVLWLYVEKIEQPPGKTLYEVQRQLTNELYIRRRAEEQQRFIESLFSKGIYSQMEEMSRRVLAVALMRYGRTG